MVKNLPVSAGDAGDTGLIPESGRLTAWSRKWQPTPVFLPGKFHGQRRLAGYSLWGHKESDMTERLNNMEHFIKISHLRKFRNHLKY